MLAARDQENLVHVHQTTAASKPLNQGTKNVLPKTPGNKVPKTPFKIPLNDKHGNIVLGGGKNGLKGRFGGNENLVTGGKKGGLGDKPAFVTPLGTRNRAPLGLKTTNAKARPFQTPAAAPGGNEVKKGDKGEIPAPGLKSQLPHVEATKLEAVEVSKAKDESEDEIEYMPPKAKELPDLPDDMPHNIDLSKLKNGAIEPGYLLHYMTRPGPDGLNYFEKKEKEDQRLAEIADRMSDAAITRDFESIRLPCIHRQECPGEECSESRANRQAAETKYQKIMAALSEEAKQPPQPSASSVSKKADLTTGPSTLTSKSAATALSQNKQVPSSPFKAKPTTKISHPSQPPSSSSAIFSRPKRTTQPPQPTNPSTMRHTAASALSKTTIGHSKGRATSAAMRLKAGGRPLPATAKENINNKNKRDTAAPAPAEITPADHSSLSYLAPEAYIQRHGVPRMGSDQWIRCYRLGYFDEEGGLRQQQRDREEENVGGMDALDDWIREEAERDFQLV